MDGENSGKSYEQMDDLGVFPYFWKHPSLAITKIKFAMFLTICCIMRMSGGLFH